MYTIKEFQTIIEKELCAQDFGKQPIGLYEPIEYVLSIGGKRIRPVLCLAACYLFTDEIDQAIRPALGFEIFHNFTLLHDDIMDRADVRRNKPTVHKKWDDNTAILSGDAMMIKAYQYLTDLPENRLKRVIDLFSSTALEVCEGQQYDMQFENQNHVAVEDYMQMIKLKTAVLLAACLKVGAIIGGASEEQASLLYDFGINIGLGFQLQDDYLDSFGDEKSFGKAIGGDILCNKKTFLLINAQSLVEGSQREILEYWIDAKEFDPTEKINAVKDIFLKVGVAELAKEKMNSYFQLAMNSLNKVEGKPEMKKELESFALKLIERIR